MYNIDDIKRYLIQRREELEEQLADINTRPFVTGQVQDSSDEAQLSIQERINISLEDNELNEYNAVLAALKRIDEGTYGTCQQCGAPIPLERLRMYPTALFCVRCQGEREEQQLQ